MSESCPIQVLSEQEIRAALKETNHMVRTSMHGAFWPELEEACRAVESAILAKLADKLKDAERYRWLVAQMMHPDADHQEEMFNRLHAINPDPANAKEVDSAIDAAMLSAAPQPAAQPEQPARKPLFADLIAQHPGLREELKAQD